MAKMGHSPNEMESVKQEKKDLMNDNPVARDASGGRPWISRHFKSTMGSPIKMGKPDYIDIDGDGNKKESMKKAAKEAGKAGGKVGTAMPKK